MKATAKPLFIALATACLGALAAPALAARDCGPRDFDSGKFAARMQERQAKMHDKLKLTPAQEPAWQAFVEKTKPSSRAGRPDMSEMSKLSTPERIEKMQAMMQERERAMSARLDAVKTFYAALTPEQQKVFDEEHAAHHSHQRGKAPAKPAHQGEKN